MEAHGPVCMLLILLECSSISEHKPINFHLEAWHFFTKPLPNVNLCFRFYHLSDEYKELLPYCFVKTQKRGITWIFLALSLWG